MANHPGLTLLHLSDLQFGPHHRFEGPGSPGSLLSRLRDDLDRLRREEGLEPDLVLLTGDLTEYGLKSHFDPLLSWIALLERDAELPKQRHWLYERTMERMAEHWQANKQRCGMLDQERPEHVASVLQAASASARRLPIA